MIREEAGAIQVLVVVPMQNTHIDLQPLLLQVTAAVRLLHSTENQVRTNTTLAIDYKQKSKLTIYHTWPSLARTLGLVVNMKMTS